MTWNDSFCMCVSLIIEFFWHFLVIQVRLLTINIMYIGRNHCLLLNIKLILGKNVSLHIVPSQITKRSKKNIFYKILLIHIFFFFLQVKTKGLSNISILHGIFTHLRLLIFLSAEWLNPCLGTGQTTWLLCTGNLLVL